MYSYEDLKQKIAIKCKNIGESELLLGYFSRYGHYYDSDEIPKKLAYYDISEYKNSERLVMRDYDPEYYHNEGFQIIGIDQLADLYPQEIDVTSFISILMD